MKLSLRIRLLRAFEDGDLARLPRASRPESGMSACGHKGTFAAVGA